MQNFIEAYGKRQITKASRAVESLGILGELQESFCELKEPSH